MMTSMDPESRVGAQHAAPLLAESHAPAWLGGRRQDAVQAQVIRFLAVVIGPVSHRDEHRGGHRERIRAKELDRLIELRVIELRERLLTELERLLEARDELLLGLRRIGGGGLRWGH